MYDETIAKIFPSYLLKSAAAIVHADNKLRTKKVYVPEILRSASQKVINS